jgi:branched-chain amino acid transport system permease protein
MGRLDRAIRPASLGSEDLSAETSTVTRFGLALGAVPFAGVALLPVIFDGSAFWLGLVALGFSFAIAFLSFTLVTGEGGMLWLSQIIFAGAGALAVGQFATVWHVPVLFAVVIGGIIAAAMGAVIGLLTIRLGDLYVAIVTLTFGALIEGLVFTRTRFLQGGAGIAVSRPSFAQSDFVFAYLALMVFAVIAVLTVNLRRSTSGLALRAVRDSEAASVTLGLSRLQVKVVVSTLAAFVAGVGGGFLAMYAKSAQPQSYDVFVGLVWLAVVVTWGARSITGTLLAGLSLSLMPGVFVVYVPARWATVPSVLFGLGAIFVARNPEGVVAQNARQLRQLLAGMTKARGVPGSDQPGESSDISTLPADVGSAR